MTESTEPRKCIKCGVADEATGRQVTYREVILRHVVAVRSCPDCKKDLCFSCWLLHRDHEVDHAH